MPDRSYLDLDVTISPTPGGSGTGGQVYSVEATAGRLGEYRGTFQIPFSEAGLAEFQVALGELAASTRPADGTEPESEVTRDARRVRASRVTQDLSDRIRTLGGRLFDALFSGAVRDCFNSAVDAARSQQVSIRIRLRLDRVPELAELPWEYLYQRSQGTSHLALDQSRSVVRYLAVERPQGSLLVTPPLRVLVAIATPPKLARLDAEAEYQGIADVLKPMVDARQVELTCLRSATRRTLRTAIKQTGAHVLHFIGHSDFGIDEAPAAAPEGEPPVTGPVLILEKAEREPDFVSLDRVCTMLQSDSLRLAVFNSCLGARADRADPFKGIAQALVQKFMPAVIAMQYRISDGAAREFAQSFYAELAEDSPVDAALLEARVSIFLNSGPVEWGTPVLFMRSPDGRLFRFNRPIAEQLRREQMDALHNEVLDYVSRREYARGLEKLTELLKLQNPGPDPGR